MTDSIEAGQIVSDMWLRLANQINDAIPHLVIADQPERAIRLAACAEACFWKATGEADTYDVKDVIERLPTIAPQVER